MLDAAFIRDHLDAVKANVANRGVRADVDRFVQLDDERRRLAQETQKIQQRQNEVSKLIPKEKDAAPKQELIAEGKEHSRTGRRPGKTAKAGGGRPARRPGDHPQHDAPGRPRQQGPDWQQGRPPMGRTAEIRFPAERSVALGESLDLVDFEAGHQWPARSFTSSRTKPHCWNWPWFNMR